jgi:uroporphyrinogen-III decarboxylase
MRTWKKCGTRIRSQRPIRTLEKGSGHIIATAQEVMEDVPLENVKALVETIVSEREIVLNL